MLADVVALSDVRVFWMFGTHFRQMQMSMPGVAAGLKELAESRLTGLDPAED